LIFKRRHRSKITVPPGATVIDYSGKTIIPGLISTHSHVGIFAGVKSAPENYNRNFILQQLREYEAYGVTAVTALGLNGPLFYELREDLHAGRVPGADLFGGSCIRFCRSMVPPAALLHRTRVRNWREESESHCGGKEDSAHSDQHWILICRSPPLRGLDELRERSHGAASIRGRSITLSNQHSHCTIAARDQCCIL
jgi:hypothetical protein